MAGQLSLEEVARRAAHDYTNALDIEDEREIQRLILAYGIGADFALVDEMVAMFTPDAVWDGTEFRFPVCRGSEEIRAHFLKECKPGTRQVHVMEPPLLAPGGDPDRAVGLVPFNALRSADGDRITAGPHTYGIYEDHYRRTPDGWRFDRRTLHLRLVRR